MACVPCHVPGPQTLTEAEWKLHDSIKGSSSRQRCSYSHNFSAQLGAKRNYLLCTRAIYVNMSYIPGKATLTIRSSPSYARLDFMYSGCGHGKQIWYPADAAGKLPCRCSIRAQLMWRTSLELTPIELRTGSRSLLRRACARSFQAGSMHARISKVAQNRGTVHTCVDIAMYERVKPMGLSHLMKSCAT